MDGKEALGRGSREQEKTNTERQQDNKPEEEEARKNQSNLAHRICYLLSSASTSPITCSTPFSTIQLI